MTLLAIVSIDYPSLRSVVGVVVVVELYRRWRLLIWGGCGDVPVLCAGRMFVL